MPKISQEQVLTQALRAIAHPLKGSLEDYDALLERVGDARFVLLGEASHGTHEFYKKRAEITQRLITEKGFNAVAVEADWPDAYQVNRYVHQNDPLITANEALAGFKRFPAWMWRNTDVLDFITWLGEYNRSLPITNPKVGFYGLDLYSLYTSIEEVLIYLEKVDKQAAERARYRYSCFDHFWQDAQGYGYAAHYSPALSCEKEAIKQLKELRLRSFDVLQREGLVEQDELFYAEQNARVVSNAEHYYRSLFTHDTISWNVRDRHMMETLVELVAHLERTGNAAKIVVWAHNSHLGNAQATEMAHRGELNLGQLVRQHYGSQAVLVGFTTYTGTVSAASDWGDIVERKHVRPALKGSYEEVFHDTKIPNFLILLRDNEKITVELLNKERLERAIGVIYRPETERLSHYFYARLPDQFDAVFHIDTTHAVKPLERTSIWERGEVPETFPSGV